MAQDELTAFFATLPVALKPVYSMASVNQPILLYSGGLELEQSTSRFPGTGTVQFEWLPGPSLRFSLESQTQQGSAPPNFEECKLHLLDMNWHAKASVLSCPLFFLSGTYTITGMIHDFEIGKEEKVASIIFHVVNFKDFHGMPVRGQEGRGSRAGRAALEAGDWRITLDKVEDAKRVFDELKAIGGFAITHVGKLERADGNKFSVAKSESVMDILFRYLSFCRGTWVAPILAVGFDEGDERVWEKWREWKIDRWKYVPNWFNDHDRSVLSTCFSGFYLKWSEETWNEAVEFSNHWYVEANKSAGGVEGSIILAQSAFELLGWTHLVEERQALSEEGYEKLTAADKLRLLLMLCEIPMAIPKSLTALTSVAPEYRWKDGPQAVTEVRNAFVHSNPSKRRKMLSKEWLTYDVWRLSLWYLELILLKTFNFNTKYSNRVAPARWRGEEVETVPWGEDLEEKVTANPVKIVLEFPFDRSMPDHSATIDPEKTDPNPH